MEGWIVKEVEGILGGNQNQGNTGQGGSGSGSLLNSLGGQFGQVYSLICLLFFYFILFYFILLLFF